MVQPLARQNSIAAMMGLIGPLPAESARQIRLNGEVRRLEGAMVNLSGETAAVVQRQSIAAGQGVRTFTPEPAAGDRFAPETLSALQQVQGLDPAGFAEVRGRSVAGTAYDGIAIQDTVEVEWRPTGVEAVEGLGYLPEGVFGNPAAEADYMRGQVERAGKLAGLEERLSQEHGQPVKLAWDPLAENYVMLRPGQRGYDDVPSAREVLEGMGRDAGKMGRLNDLRGVLAQYGVNV
jgi:hypothetical protein